MNSWIYFATAEKASLTATLGFVLNAQFLWRSARNSSAALIANVAHMNALTQQRLGRFSFPHHGLEEWLTDLYARERTTTQSVWKVNCGVSVGGQTILGLKHLAELARTVGAHCWPFDGWGIPGDPAIWFAEMFPSLVQYDEWSAAYAVSRDRTEVQSCVRRAAERDRDRLLKRDFDAPHLDQWDLARVAGEEGWILWV